MSAAATPMTAEKATLRRRLLLALKVAASAAAFVWLFHIVEPADLASALARVSPGAFALSVSASIVALFIGSLRWWALLDAYGATARPRYWHLVRLTLVGHFYNTLLPGAVGGDVLRGYATRDAFGARSATAAVAVTLVERVLGLAVLLLMTATLALARPIPGVHGLIPLSALGVGAAAVALLTISQGYRVGPRLPGRVGRLVAELPRIARPVPFAFAVLLSVGTQTCATLGVYPLLHALVPRIGLLETAALVPVALAASYFPFTVGGAGAREGAFVALLGAIGVAHADALATSLLAFAALALLGAAGGVVHLVWPLDPAARAPSAAAPAGKPTAEGP